MNRVPVADASHTSRFISSQVVVLAVVFVILGCLSVKRIVNGNGDLSGNYSVWRANLKAPVQPGRYLSTELRLQDPDPYPPITYAMFAYLAVMPLWLLAILWFAMNVACTLYLWRSLRCLLDELSSPPGTAIEDHRTVAGASSHSSGMKTAVDDSTAKSPPILPQPSAGAQPQQRVIECPGWLTNERILQLVALAVLPSWIGALLIGQNTLLVMTLVTAAYRTNLQGWGRSIKAGVLISLAMAMKVLPAVFVLPFIFRRQFRVLAGFVLGGSVLLFGIGTLFFGIEKNCEFHVRWLQFAVHGPENRPPDPHDPNTLRGSLRDKNQAIEAVLARLLMDIPIHNRTVDAPTVHAPDTDGPIVDILSVEPPHVNLMSVSASTWRMSSTSLLATCVLIAGSTVLLSQYASHKLSLVRQPKIIRQVSNNLATAARRDTTLGRLAILAPTQLFISPVLWSHYYLWLSFPIALILFETQRGRPRGIWIYAAWLAVIPCLAFELCRAIGMHLWMSLVIYLWVCWPAIQSAFTASHETELADEK